MVAVRVNRQIVQKKMPAPNERFCAIAAARPLKNLWELAILYPAAALVECRYCCKAASALAAIWGQRSEK